MNRKEISPYFKREKFDKEFIDFLSRDGKGLVAMFKAYFDESGTHGDSPLVVVAGWVGNQKTWKSFIKEWNFYLERAGIPYFHAKDPKCESLKVPLAKIILERNLYGIAWSVNRLDFRNNVSQQFMSQFGNEYSACAFHCVGIVSQYMKDNGYYQTALLFEAGQPNNKFIYDTVNGMITSQQDTRLYSIDFLLKKDPESIPLQASDFLSHVIATNDTKWVKLFKEHKIPPYIMKMYPGMIRDTAKQVRDIIIQSRAERKKDKKE